MTIQKLVLLPQMVSTVFTQWLFHDVVHHCRVFTNHTFFVIIFVATGKFANDAFVGIVIGFGITLHHFISIPFTYTSVNPDRLLSQAIFVQSESLKHLWFCYLPPILVAIVGGLIYKYLLQNHSEA